MGYIFAYLLLALVVDLILTIIRPERERQAPMVSQRRLWNDTICDCRSIMVPDGTASFGYSRRPMYNPKKSHVFPSPDASLCSSPWQGKGKGDVWIEICGTRK